MYGGGSGSTYTDVDALAGLTDLTELYLPYRRYDYENPLPLVDLGGLRNLAKLQTLNVNGDVANLESLRNLSELRSLNLSSSGQDSTMSLEPLSGLSKLTELSFNGKVQNRNLSALSGLTELRSLQVYHNSWNSSNYTNTYIWDLTPLSGLTKLNSVTISGTAEGIGTSPVSHAASCDIR